MEIMDTDIILKTNFHDIKLVKRGKVRDVYEIGEYFLIVSTDRLSAFDVIMSQGIPDKGKVLTKISEFWFNETRNIVRNHVVTTVIDEFPEVCQKYRDQLQGRSMIVKKAKVIPIECIVRGYISGSGWNDYKKTGKISGIDLPNGLKESEKLPEPLFTPSTKAEIGTHDENISFDQAEKIIDKETLKEVKKAALDIYKTSSNLALKKGIIIADTKMEFGLIDGEVILVDELLTPDSSRFWPENNYKVGQAQQSYDKQFVRDYLLSINFNKQPPPPILPEDIIQKTRKKYLDVLYKLTGERLT
jgi:phosphoribosylaminoimidazole-succinocarboxamide synthase